MKKLSKNLICFLVVGLLCFNVFLPAVGAASLEKNLSDFNQAAGLPGSDDISVLDIVFGIINALLGLLGLFFVILMIYAGFIYMTAQGDDKKVEKAKAIIKNAVIGVAIILLSYAITRIVFTSILNVVDSSGTSL